MDTAFSILISVGLIAFGASIVAGTSGSDSPLVWALLGLLTVVTGLTSLYPVIRGVKT